jgi:hypothetical protein
VNCPEIPAIWLMPSAMPHWRAGKASVRMAGMEMITIDASIVAMVTLSVVLESAIHL